MSGGLSDTRAGVELISAMDDGIGPYVEFTDAWRDLSGEEQASKAAGWVRAALAVSAGSGEPSELASEGGAHKSSPGNLPVGEVEAVAKAIRDSARQENPDIPIHWTFYEDEARAAIAALDASRQRDPQEGRRARMSERATEALYELSRGQQWPGIINGIPTTHVGYVTVVDTVLDALALGNWVMLPAGTEFYGNTLEANLPDAAEFPDQEFVLTVRCRTRTYEPEARGWYWAVQQTEMRLSGPGKADQEEQDG